MRLSGYRTMWVIAMFDLPVTTPAAKREYTRFRKLLQRSGFIMLQFSVYGRACASEEQAATQCQRIFRGLPPRGQVRVLTLTDRQFARMRVFWGKRSASLEEPPEQLEFF